MITSILSDFSKVLLFSKDGNYTGSLNGLNRSLIEEFGENYNFFDYFKLNQELLDVYQTLQEEYPIYIFTSDAIQNRPEVREVIDPIISGLYSAKDFNVSKKKSASYLLIAEKMNKTTAEILYIDDQLENIEAAQQAGMRTVQFRHVDMLMLELKNLGFSVSNIPGAS